MEIILFTAPHRCQPCRLMEHFLNSVFPSWTTFIKVINVDYPSSEEDIKLMNDYNIMRLPSITIDGVVKYTGYKNTTPFELKELCKE